jgi:hypothetical protein
MLSRRRATILPAALLAAVVERGIAASRTLLAMTIQQGAGGPVHGIYGSYQRPKVLNHRLADGPLVWISRAAATPTHVRTPVSPLAAGNSTGCRRSPRISPARA